jgi:hypothetical protein
VAGYLGELKPLIVVVSFLALFAVLAGTIPGEFYAASYEGRHLDVPEYFDVLDIYSFADVWNGTFSHGAAYEIEIGGHNLEIAGYNDAEEICVWRYATFWIFKYSFQPMEWRTLKIKISNRTETYGFSAEYLKITQLDKYGYGTIYKLKCKDLELYASFGYNQTEYDTHLEAFHNEALHLFFGIHFDQVSTSFSAWDLIGMILFFQMPDVHPIINIIIAIPLWISIAYLTFALILKVIPFVSG